VVGAFAQSNFHACGFVLVGQKLIIVVVVVVVASIGTDIVGASGLEHAWGKLCEICLRFAIFSIETLVFFFALM